jgi:transcriptional regulator with XRE-family HTH domain
VIATVEFGKFVKDARLGKGIIARAASEAAEMLPSNFSKLEHGALNPPRDSAKQKKLAAAIGIKEGSPEAHQFFDLAAKANESIPVDIADIISEDDALPLLLRTIGNKRLKPQEIKRLVEIVRGKGGNPTLQQD